jgi:hypothetical protein
MASTTGPYLDRNGLVFYYDTRNPNESFKGRPTTNFMGNGNFKNGNGIENENGSWGTYDIVALKNPGRSSYVLRQQTGEYEIHFKSGTSIQPNTTYCQSVWVAYTDDWNGATQIQHSRYYNGSGTGYAIGGAGTLIETKVIDGLTWERRYATFTTQGTVNGSYSWYLGYSAGATTGYRYLADVQLEVGNYPSPFVDGTRSATEGLVDIMRNATIDASGVSGWTSTNGLAFDGSDDFLSIDSDLLTNNSEYTLEALLLPPDGTAWGSNAIPLYNTYNNSSAVGFWHHFGHDNILRWRHGGATYSVGDLSGIGLVGGQWQVTTITWDNTTLRLYKNGVQTNSTTAPSGFSRSPGQPRIGKLATRTSGTPYTWNGEIAAHKVWNRALSPEEVKVSASMYKSITG